MTSDTAVDDTADGDTDVQHERLLRFVERFAMVLADSGMPRMPARVFAYALAADGEQWTAGELATALRVSPAAISGALRYLVPAGLLDREREPGSRSDHYRIAADDIWSHIYFRRAATLAPYEELAAEGVAVLGPDGAGARRMRETQAFMAFLRAELPRLMEGWQRHRADLQDGPGPVPD